MRMTCFNIRCHISHTNVEENLHYLIPFLYHTLPSMVLTFKVLSPCPRLVAKSDFFFLNFFFIRVKYKRLINYIYTYIKIYVIWFIESYFIIFRNVVTSSKSSQNSKNIYSSSFPASLNFPACCRVYLLGNISFHIKCDKNFLSWPRTMQIFFASNVY